MNPMPDYRFEYYHEGFFGYSLTPVFEEFSRIPIKWNLTELTIEEIPRTTGLPGFH